MLAWPISSGYDVLNLFIQRTSANKRQFSELVKDFNFIPTRGPSGAGPGPLEADRPADRAGQQGTVRQGVGQHRAVLHGD